MKTTRRDFILTTGGTSLGALASGCASSDSAAKAIAKRTGVLTLPAQDIPT